MNIRRQNSGPALNQDCRTWWLNSPVTRIAWKHMLAVTPLVDSLIIYVSVRLWQEGLKAALNAQLYG